MKEYFRCKVEEEELERFVAWFYSDLFGVSLFFVVAGMYAHTQLLN